VAALTSISLFIDCIFCRTWFYINFCNSIILGVGNKNYLQKC